MEHSWLKVGQPVKQTVSKLSAVKQKGTNPKWQPKKQLSDKKDDEESSEKKPCAHGCHSGKEVKKHQAKQADEHKEDEAESLQLASSTFMAALAFMTVTGCGAILPPAQPQHLNRPLAKRFEPQPFMQHITMEKATMDPCKCAAPQEFAGAPIGGLSVYEEYHQARGTLAKVNLPKTELFTLPHLF